ncbi:BTB/POZ domain-containing protein KCTD11 [Pelodiscus sinensis]|uniref:Potassium channel tetramerization domain containing 11 n=1 Tax=Pelodiscus sinensis TaxID=13735 RepID=K7EZM9_PELSI|nr:BTB/POZ domain-containing protein KCTD11 [Pelodiscus sinensis]XP_025044012.1 BTB/POZ domain-containing protein KCTD11 [Pelodiscus sinensis]|eukprot:XP_025044010.1 BTB/POZ domain-containing protein KCTD11 [Pelodiscus sinensis]
MGEEEENKRKMPTGTGDHPLPARAVVGLPVGPITLNVGGKFYTTTMETLTRFPDSMLGAMFRGPRPASTDQRGHYFIDRDGKAFRHILNFLRLGRLDLPEGYSELALLRAEADFYQIRPLLAELSQLAAECQRRQTRAVLHTDIDCQERLLHFTVRHGPQNYGLSTSPLRIFTANVFCTDGHFLELLRDRLGQASDGASTESDHQLGPLGAARDGESIDTEEEGSGHELFQYSLAKEKGEARSQHHLHLEWAPRPPDLPEVEYAKQKVRSLWTAAPDGREVSTAADFLEEVLKAALDQGFRVDSVFPDPADILNSRSLRFVRH